MTNRLARCAVALALTPLVSGCIAAVAIPLVAGGALYARDKVRVRAATPRPEAKSPDVAAKVTLLSIHDLPPPSGAQETRVIDRWQAFFDYALAASHKDRGEPLESAVLAAGSSLEKPARLACRTAYPAVVIDLDRGKTPFTSAAIAAPPAKLVDGLAKLREAGVTVMWITQLLAAQAGEVSDALKASGLDPKGLDPLLLIRSPEDRKQVLRQDANNDVCVVAVAGDRRADFDELFDYLRDPSSALGLYSMMRAGWFLTPAPLDPAGDATDNLQSLDAQEAG